MSTKGKEYKLAIRIAGVIDKSFTTSLTAANGTLKKTVASMDKDFTRMDKGFDKIVSVGWKGFQAIATAAGVAATAIGAATAAAIHAGSEFETAFASVKKTVDATEEGYAKLKQDILDMAKVIPESAASIAEVMAIAGQLGIANENLVDFTETMINLGVSTNLSAEEAATALAKFANITGMDPKNYERLGSVIVDLGNNFATTEEEIVHMATRLSSTGDLVGLSEAQIMALATAMSSVGIASESGGSTMSKLLKKMQMAVETNSESLADYAAVSGMTGEQFKKTFKEDAVVALSAFIDGIDNVERNGKTAIAVLDDMGLTEVRLSNTILALAGGEEVMSNAITTANEAWEENTALAIEAGKRYETTESQIQLMKNAFKELGIVAYDDLRKPFVGTIGTIREKVQGLTEYVGGPNGMSEWIQNIGTELPTLQRKFKKHGEPVFNFIVGTGKWIVKHGDGIVSVLTGIGWALATYKVASTLTHIVAALMVMNPVSLGIVSLASVIAGVVSALTAYKKHEQNLVDNSLQEHFGSIALSMEDIQAVAEHIVSSDSLGGVKDALAAFEDLETISGNMENSIEALNKMNWKVSIGMELTADEQESYKTAIAEYVASAQEYAEQSMYAVSLNLATGLGGDSDIASKVNQFYQDSYNTMATLGQDLSDAVNEAFADNVLAPEEINNIANIQAKMADLQDLLATGEFDAKLSLLGMEYAGGALDSDSFQNLQAELAAQTAAANEVYKESYAKNYAAIQAAYAYGEYLTNDEYEAALKSIEEEYLKNISETQAKSVNFQIETIMKQYSKELDPAIREYIQNIQETLGNYTENGEWDWLDRQGILWTALLGDVLESGTLDKTTMGAISQLLETMAPTMAETEALIQQYRDMGAEIPTAVLEGMSSYNMLNALANNDYYSVAGVVGEQMANGKHSGFYQGMLESMKEIGGYIPEEVSKGITSATELSIRPAVEGMYAWTQETINEYMAQGFKASANVNLQLSPALRGLNGINNRANGGLATRPELTWFAENCPEMAIPIDGSQNAKSLWRQTGRLLGMDSAFSGLDLSGGSSPAIEYSPTLQFYGEAPSKNDLEDALRVSQEEFESLMERYFKTHGRVSFG